MSQTRWYSGEGPSEISPLQLSVLSSLLLDGTPRGHEEWLELRASAWCAAFCSALPPGVKGPESKATVCDCLPNGTSPSKPPTDASTESWLLLRPRPVSCPPRSSTNPAAELPVSASSPAPRRRAGVCTGNAWCPPEAGSALGRLASRSYVGTSQWQGWSTNSPGQLMRLTTARRQASSDAASLLPPSPIT